MSQEEAAKAVLWVLALAFSCESKAQASRLSGVFRIFHWL